MKKITCIIILMLIITGCSQTKVYNSDVEVTKAEFDIIKNGMSYEEVVEVLGGDGEMVTESGNPGEDLHTVAYGYNGDGSIGANVSLMFQGGILITKGQTGLE